MKPKLLIINKCQFGYLTDSYKWCEYLREEYDIKVLCINSNLPKISIPGVNVKYVNFNYPFLIRSFLFTIISLITVLTFKGKIFVVYYPTCSILKRILPWKKIHVDVRTLSVKKDSKIRKSNDKLLIKDCSYFDSISAISKGVADKMELPNIKILPLGSDIISTKSKNYTDRINLLYVGTLSNRNIEQTISGLKLFIDKFPNQSIQYDIIGDGFYDELQIIKNTTEKLHLANIVKIHGRVPYNKLKKYFDNSNIGISYIPITEYYQNQPPTKTYEYILSGLFCLATATNSNKELITTDNGILIQDDPESFCKGLEIFINNRAVISEKKIKESLSQYTWGNIVKNKLKPIIESI